jgi:hypothetical protein
LIILLHDMSGRRLTPSEIAAYVRQAGFPEELVPTKVAIAMAESSGNPFAHNRNRRTGDDSHGIFQINMLDRMGPERRKQFGIASNEQLFDPAVNARAAKNIYDSQGLGAWSVYKSGKYKDYLSEAQKAAATPGSTQPMAGQVSASPAPMDVAAGGISGAPSVTINFIGADGKILGSTQAQSKEKKAQSFLDSFRNELIAEIIQPIDYEKFISGESDSIYG